MVRFVENNLKFEEASKSNATTDLAGIPSFVLPILLAITECIVFRKDNSLKKTVHDFLRRVQTF